MNTRAVAAEYRLAHWASIMRERKESGISVREFCENAGIHENSYYYWQKKLRETACGNMIKSQHENTSLAPAGFTEVKLIDHAQQVNPVISSQNHVRVETAGVHVIADGEYPVEKLVLLLRELRWQP